ncbi:MAG: hypothetical protein CMD39_11510 [Gammaproteobacteria bacterium]|nr:hypothetical protein [Gammaproteobacteria bacterium]|tara:strand:- start:4349 stop:5440 length:1092 start_codon:yes stop_codon:yes gene_type:complete
MKLTVEDLPDIATGAALLGTGGGGDPYIGRLLAMHAIEAFGMPEVIDAAALPDDANVFTIAMLGVPTVLGEKAACGDDVDLAVRSLEQYLGRRADALVGIEIGGINSLLPVMAAARLGLPLVDADGMGRAFPEIQMVTYNVYGVPATPLVVTDDHLTSLVVDTRDAAAAEGLVRVASVQMGCSVILSSYPMTGEQVKRTGVHGTLTLALEIGRAIRHGRETGDPVTALVDYLRTTPYYNQCEVLFDGKVVDLSRETRGGFNMGFCHLEALDGSRRRLEVTFQNEHLVAREGGRVRCIVPDLIALVDRETAAPVPAEALRYGQRLKVIGISAAPIMRTPESLAVFGPQAFGLDDPFVPIEQLGD